MGPDKTKVERLTGVPANRVDATIAQYRADPNYISHTSTPEDSQKTTYTIEVTLRDTG